MRVCVLAIRQLFCLLQHVYLIMFTKHFKESSDDSRKDKSLLGKTMKSPHHKETGYATTML